MEKALRGEAGTKHNDNKETEGTPEVTSVPLSDYWGESNPSADMEIYLGGGFICRYYLLQRTVVLSAHRRYRHTAA